MKRFPPRRILVAADISTPSLAALDAAKELALRWGSELEIVHVQHPPLLAPWVGLDGMPSSVPPIPTEARRKIEERLRRAAAGFPRARLKFRTVHGWPPAALLALARPERADLLVMGTHGYSGLERLLTGSVAEAVLKRARIPVLVVPERKGFAGGGRVLAPWNGRPYATRALRWARELTDSLHSTLDVLYVDEAGHPIEKDAAMGRRLVALLGTGPGWMLRKHSGDARARIISESNSGRYELVVLSAHRRSSAADFVRGSTIERLLRRSAVPVLAVPSAEPRRDSFFRLINVTPRQL